MDRKKLLAIRGRGHKSQLGLAAEYGITGFACPAGGCLLTDKNFARRMKDLMTHKETITLKDINILKVGRHFRFHGNKIVAGRNEKDEFLLLIIISFNILVTISVL